MKKSIRLITATLAVAAIHCAAFGSGNVLGVWHGKVRFDLRALKPLPNPRANSSRLQTMYKIMKATITLTIKGDHSYTLITLGAPGPSREIVGTWKFDGKYLSLQQLDHGRPIDQPIAYTVAQTGRSFSVSRTANGVTSSISFFK